MGDRGNAGKLGRNVYREAVEALLATLARVRVSNISMIPKLNWAVGSGWGRWTGMSSPHICVHSSLMFSFT